MKKTLLYSLAVLASVTLASCNGDYDDWANPQANEQEASAAKYGITFAAGPEAESSMPDADGVINLVTVNTTDANVTGYTLKSLKVNGEAINGEIDGNNIQVNAAELEKILCNQNNSRASVARDMKVESKVSVNLASGDAVAINSVGETTGKFTPTATPQLDEKGYYMLGQINGNEWDAKSPVWMNKISDGVYQLKVTTTADKNRFKFYAGSKYDEGGDWKIIDTGALGCKENGCEDSSGYIYFYGDSWGKLQTMVIPGAGTWIVTLDMNNLTYSFAKPVLYMAGDANGWDQIDYMKERIVFFTCIVLTCLFSPLSSQEVDTRSCVSTYTNQTVSSSVSVLGCNTLAVQNVTVASNGNLSLSAPAQITINGPFEVKSGGILNIRQSQQMIFTYTYDASGNRTTRQFSAMASSLEAVPVDQEED